jgi:hypothetical protein
LLNVKKNSVHSSFFLHILRICRKYLNIFGEYAESIFSRIRGICRKNEEYDEVWKIRRKYLIAFGENAERILPYSPKKTKRHKIEPISAIFWQKPKVFEILDLMSFKYIGSNEQKTISRYCPFNGLIFFPLPRFYDCLAVKNG